MIPAGTGKPREVMLTVTGEETYADGHKDRMRTRSLAVHEKTPGTGSGGEALSAHKFR